MRKAIKAVIGVVFVIVTASTLGTIGYFLSRSKLGIVVTTKNGNIQGIISVSRDGRELYEWLGIPYAEPPHGYFKFASPKPAKNWTDVRDGSEYGPICSQKVVLGTYSRPWGSEDCLYLNIFVPKLGGKKLLPVMVWIHGGAFIFGSSNDYRPEYFMDQDVVLRTMNYRLGPFGTRPSLTFILGELGGKLPALLGIPYVLTKLFWKKLLGIKGRDYGVRHGDEIPMLFLMPGLFNLAKDYDDPDYLFSKTFVKLWADFAKDAANLELNGVEFEPAPKSGPLKYFHLSENASVQIPFQELR